MARMVSLLQVAGRRFANLLSAARKAVGYGYRVFILPNPKNIRTADFIFERKGVYKMFDLKTIMGKSSAENRLLESIGQTNHVLLNMATDYEPRLLAKDVKTYFEANKNAREVLIKDMKSFNKFQIFWYFFYFRAFFLPQSKLFSLSAC